METNLFLAVLFELLCKCHHFSLKLFVRSNLSTLFLTFSIWASCRWSCSMVLTLLIFIKNRRWLMLCSSTSSCWASLRCCRCFFFTRLGWWRAFSISSRRLASSCFFSWRFIDSLSLWLTLLRFGWRFTLRRIGSLDHLWFIFVWVFFLSFALLSLFLFLPFRLHDVVH